MLLTFVFLNIKGLLIDYLVILHLQLSRNNDKEIYSKIKYTWRQNVLWWL